MNKVKLNQAAKVLGTFQEVLTTQTELTKEQLIDMDRLIHILTDENHPQHLALKDFLKNPPKTLKLP